MLGSEVISTFSHFNKKLHSLVCWFSGKKRKWPFYILMICVLMLLVMKYNMVESPISSQYFMGFFTNGTSDHLHLEHLDLLVPAVQNPDDSSEVISYENLVSGLLIPRNFSQEEKRSVQTWKYLKPLVAKAAALPHFVEAIQEAKVAWETLMASVEEERLFHIGNGSISRKAKDKQCPYSVSKMNDTELGKSGFKLQIPCGLVQGSSVTVIGTPVGLLGNFQIDLRGTELPGEPDPPIILHYNVRLHGDKVTEDPVIVQNTWTAPNDWGPEERCPSPSENAGKVDELDQCNPMVGKENKRKPALSKHFNSSKRTPELKNIDSPKTYFPFKQGYPSVATLRVGLEGIQMTVDGKHITSFAYRDSLEPWLVNDVRISGDLKLHSVLASGLPSSEDVDHAVDLETLKAIPLGTKQQLDLFIGIFSTANNFKRRMAVRRTWMQYDSVRNGKVAVRFFVGLHKNTMVNEELWNEARTYGDTQLMPFVDYYSLITLKSVAICVYGTKAVNAKYIMKTDDDAFVRVDEILASLNEKNIKQGLLYGLINYDSEPHRDPESKWYISPEEWPEDKYPPWAHGPGYVISHDIADLVVRKHKKRRLKMFKLEDVAMGMWIADLKKGGLAIQYVNDDRVYNTGCTDGYVVAHYQEPREMLCLWQRLSEGRGAICCNRR
ncbi:beta-1,3-galactosyltransferase GALT1 [Nymphaea colorata]|nr:beta-1,3-galactosyltransferase GALT1 [Nymphaea colorata]XP_031475171.1 beta-1,3-galactosyltransferase GALT1 [Nymphaea colorata]